MIIWSESSRLGQPEIPIQHFDVCMYDNESGYSLADYVTMDYLSEVPEYFIHLIQANKTKRFQAIKEVKHPRYNRSEKSQWLLPDEKTHNQWKICMDISEEYRVHSNIYGIPISNQSYRKGGHYGRILFKDVNSPRIKRKSNNATH